jgi:hypothetical protein
MEQKQRLVVFSIKEAFKEGPLRSRDNPPPDPTPDFQNGDIRSNI